MPTRMPATEPWTILRDRPSVVMGLQIRDKIDFASSLLRSFLTAAPEPDRAVMKVLLHFSSTAKDSC